MSTDTPTNQGVSSALGESKQLKYQDPPTAGNTYQSQNDEVRQKWQFELPEVLVLPQSVARTLEQEW